MSSTLPLVVGDDWENIPVTFTDNNGDPYPLTGKTITGFIKFHGNNNLMEVDVTEVDLANGEISFSKSDEYTVLMPMGAISKLKFYAVEDTISKTIACIDVLGVECL